VRSCQDNKSGSTATKDLTTACLSLAAPYLAVAAMGIIWYKKYRRKDVKLDVRHEKLNLN